MGKNNNNCIVLKVDDQTKNKMISFYKQYAKEKQIPYVSMQATNEDVVITIYEKNKKGENKVMFQGVSADVEASIWEMEHAAVENTKKEQSKDYSKYYNCSSIGSDEVGTGDYFGPIVVTSCYVSKEDIPFVESLGIKDSKKLDDNKILKIAPEVAKKIKYKSIILSNKEYNEKYNNNDNNINKIKAIMHNKVLWKMVHEENLNYDYIIVDMPSCKLIPSAAVIADLCDDLLFVEKCNHSTITDIKNALKYVLYSKAKFIGFILNDYNPSVTGYGYGRYGYSRYGYAGGYRRYSYGYRKGYGYGYSKRYGKYASKYTSKYFEEPENNKK